MNSSSSPSWLKKMFSPRRLTAGQLRAKAERDGPEAQNNLGILFTSCSAFEGNDVAGAECFQSAATRGHALAQYNLSLMYERGRGVGQDAQEARMWLSRSAEQGDPGAQFHLGTSCHRESFGNVEPEERKIEALKWLLLAAAQEYPNAETSSGSLILTMSHEQLDESNRRVAAFNAARVAPGGTLTTSTPAAGAAADPK